MPISSFPLVQVATAAPSRGMSPLEYVNAGGPLSYVMVLLSLVAVALVARNVLALQKSRIVPPEAVRELEARLRVHDLSGALRYCMQQTHRSFLVNVFEQALERCTVSGGGAAELRAALEDAAQPEVDKLHSMNDGIGIIAAVGPMLGLLGTVIGMIGAFQTIGALEGGTRSSRLAEFMSLALVNTAEGLIIAIPCTVIFALFRRRIVKLVGEAGRVIEGMICLVAPRSDASPHPHVRPAAPAEPVAPIR
jgi:biopolymer transport protein ExbB